MSRVLAILQSNKLALRTLMVALLAVWPAPTIVRADANDFARAGFAAKERREYSLAIKLFDAALREGNFDKKKQGFLIYSRGVSYEGLGIRDKALADFDAAIALLPNFPNSYIYRGLIWAYEREYDRAIEDLSRARDLSPKDPMIFNNLGGVYEKQGNLDRAIENYHEALRLQPGYAEAYYNRAEVFLAKGELERAFADYDQAIWLQPTFADAYGNRGILHLMRGEAEKAMADFGTAITLRPRDPTFWTNRANAYLTVADYRASQSDFDQALQIDPGNPAIYLGRGRARLFASDTANAIEDFKTAVRLRASNPYPVIWLHIARVHSGNNDREELSENAARVKRDMWPTILLDFYLGTATSDQIRNAADNGPPRDKEKRICEADLFIAESAVHDGRSKELRPLFEGVMQRCRRYDVVYGAALAELHFLRKSFEK